MYFREISKRCERVRGCEANGQTLLPPASRVASVTTGHLGLTRRRVCVPNGLPRRRLLGLSETEGSKLTVALRFRIGRQGASKVADEDDSRTELRTSRSSSEESERQVRSLKGDMERKSTTSALKMGVAGTSVTSVTIKSTSFTEVGTLKFSNNSCFVTREDSSSA